MFVYDTFSSVWIAEWKYFDKKAANSLGRAFSLCFLLFVILDFSRFGFEGGYGF